MMYWRTGIYRVFPKMKFSIFTQCFIVLIWQKIKRVRKKACSTVMHEMLYYPLKYYSVIVLRYWQCGSKMLTSLCSITWNGIWNRLFAKITSSWKKPRLQYLVSNILVFCIILFLITLTYCKKCYSSLQKD